LSAALLRPLPVRDGGRLFVPGVQDSSGRFAGMARDGFVYTAIARLRGSGTFERLAAEWAPPLVLLVQNNVQANVQTNATPVRTAVGFATFEYFDLLGVRVALGADSARRTIAAAPHPWRFSPTATGARRSTAGPTRSAVGLPSQDRA
jgi:hypothetical protein